MTERVKRHLVFSRIIRETEAALLVDFEDHGETWVPKSQIEAKGRDYTAGDRNGSMMVNEWWCSKEMD